MPPVIHSGEVGLDIVCRNADDVHETHDEETEHHGKNSKFGIGLLHIIMNKAGLAAKLIG